MAAAKSQTTKLTFEVMNIISSLVFLVSGASYEILYDNSFAFILFDSPLSLRVMAKKTDAKVLYEAS